MKKPLATIRQEQKVELMRATTFQQAMPDANINSNIRQIVEESDIKGALQELNKGTIDPDTNMSDIDMRTRLADLEISALLQIDMLIGMEFLPQQIMGLTRQKKRLAISRHGLGRDEIIKIVSGMREHEQKKGWFGTSFGAPKQ